MRRTLYLLAALAALASPASAQDTWVYFDDRPAEMTPIVGAYHGLDWTNFSTVGDCLPEPWCPGFLSYPNIARNTSGPVASFTRVGGIPFTFLGGVYSTFTSWDTRIQLEGFLGGSLVYDLSFVATPNSLNAWMNEMVVDEVRFTATIEDAEAPDGAAAIFTIDNLVYNPSVVPEPQTLALCAAGLAALVWVRRRRRTA